MTMTTKSATATVSSKKVEPTIAAVITARDIGKSFGKGQAIISDLSFDVNQGQIFCLLGPSGSGKSTTVRMLTGVFKPTTGYLRVLGVAPHTFSRKLRSRIGYMPQQFVLYPELTTLENINLVASAYAMSWIGRRQKIQQALEFVDLWDARNRLASHLSGGMQRRLELASTLVHEPELIFVDEPTAGIDPMLRAKFWEQFKALRAAGRTLFVTTQYVTEADYCDVVAILSRGQMLALGSPESIRRQAMGGEIIDMTLTEVTAQTLHLLHSLPQINEVQTLIAGQLRLIVDNASDALQEIVALFHENNVHIQNISPYRPDFEEVFVRLMQLHLAEAEDEEKELEPDATHLLQQSHSQLKQAKNSTPPNSPRSE